MSRRSSPLTIKPERAAVRVRSLHQLASWYRMLARRLGKTPARLRDEILDITALFGEKLPGKQAAERARLLLAIPDDGILRQAE